MDKIFMKILLAQASIDIIFNAYQRHPAFDLTQEDIISYLDIMDSHLHQIQKILIDKKLLKPDMIALLESDGNQLVSNA